MPIYISSPLTRTRGQNGVPVLAGRAPLAVSGRRRNDGAASLAAETARGGAAVDALVSRKIVCFLVWYLGD